MDIIKFKNIEYKIREIQLSDIGNVLISVTSLSEALMNNNSRYISKEAESIDDEIYFFVEDSEIELPNDELLNLLKLQTT